MASAIGLLCDGQGGVLRWLVRWQHYLAHRQSDCWDLSIPFV